MGPAGPPAIHCVEGRPLLGPVGHLARLLRVVQDARAPPEPGSGSAAPSVKHLEPTIDEWVFRAANRTGFRILSPSFNKWCRRATPMTAEGGGVWYAEVPKARSGDEFNKCRLLTRQGEDFTRRNPCVTTRSAQGSDRAGVGSPCGYRSRRLAGSFPALLRRPKRHMSREEATALVPGRIVRLGGRRPSRVRRLCLHCRTTIRVVPIRQAAPAPCLETCRRRRHSGTTAG